MSRKLNSKRIVFVAVMAALGNVLSALSIQLSPGLPSIPLAPGVTFSLALDLSHVTTFIAALFGGPAIGGLTGLVGGLVAAFEFGFSQGNLITGFGLPLGKAMTGVAAGLLMPRLGVSRNHPRSVVATVASYVPEAAFTAMVFLYLLPLFYGLPMFMANLVTVEILVKAFVEMVVMGTVLALMLGNRGFTQYVEAYFPERWAKRERPYPTY